MIPIDKDMVHGIIQSTSSGQESYDLTFFFYNKVKNHMIHPKIICNMTMPEQNCFFLHNYRASSKIQLCVTPLNGAKIRINNLVNTTQFIGNSNSSSDKKLNTSCRWYHTFQFTPLKQKYRADLLLLLRLVRRQRLSISSALTNTKKCIICSH